MSRNATVTALIAAALALPLVPQGAGARGIGVEVWTDRGQDAVYNPGDAMQIKVRASDDAYLLVYEIDTEGDVHVLYPYQGENGYVGGRRTLRVPGEDSNNELVVEQTTGESYIVALASDQPFRDLPWYLRPYDEHSEGVAYEGQPDEEEGVTGDGRIVGDPFVAMERIRRRVLRSPGDPESFGTAYTSYYVHDRVRYPRYLCYDCHRPGYYAWWDGFDPYYSTCPVVDFRLNWGWSWGPGYWFGSVPYFVYVPRAGCPPYWRRHWDGPWYSSWDGWNRWNGLWGGPLRRHFSPPPTGYVPPNKYNDPDRWRGRDAVPLPPGFMASNGPSGRYRTMLPIGHNREARNPDGTPARELRPGAGGRIERQDRPSRMPVREVRPGGEGAGGWGQGRRVERPSPAYSPPREGGRQERPAPAYTPREGGRQERPAPAYTPRGGGRQERPAPAYTPRGGGRSERPAPAPRESHGGGSSREARWGGRGGR